MTEILGFSEIYLALNQKIKAGSIEYEKILCNSVVTNTGGISPKDIQKAGLILPPISPFGLGETTCHSQS
jgi:hypothetical protein